jgi:hypothetical protein
VPEAVLPPVRGARGIRRPQDGRGGMPLPPESQKEATHPRASCGKEPGSTAKAAVDGREEAMELAQ